MCTPTFLGWWNMQICQSLRIRSNHCKMEIKTYLLGKWVDAPPISHPLLSLVLISEVVEVVDTLYGAPDLNTATFVQRPNQPWKKKKRGSTKISSRLAQKFKFFHPKNTSINVL